MALTFSARITLLVRPQCHLCTDAREVVARVADDLGVQWTEFSIADDVDLTARYGDEVPVVFVDGVQHDFWRVDERRLRSALSRKNPADG